jgi:hypothetical protein
VTALDDTGLWYLDGSDFVAAATGDEGPAANRVWRATGQAPEQILAGVPLFAGIDSRELASAGEVISVPPGESLVREGEPGDRFYVLLDGEVQVTIGGRSVRTLAAGDWFGEIALLHNVPRTATVTATTEAKLWTLGRRTFLASLGEAAPVDPAAPDAALPGAGLLV